MRLEGVESGQLRALRDLAQLRKDRDLAALAAARATVSDLEAQLADLDAAVRAAQRGVAVQPDPCSLAALDAYIRLSRRRREAINTDLARARARVAEVQQQAVRATGQIEVLEKMQALQDEEARIAQARLTQG